MSSLTKVAKGIAYGDVSNIAIRNILTQLSVQLYGKFTEQDLEDTNTFFEGRCPYTGEPITPENSVIDHICPQNKERCGLNIKGNLIRVTNKANKAKGSQDYEDFIRHNTSVINADRETREARIKKIKEWQEQCHYDSANIREQIHPLLADHYDNMRKTQEELVAKAVAATGLPILKPIGTTAKHTTRSKGALPTLTFEPSDEDAFTAELLRTKRAVFTLTYDSGAVKTSLWKADEFSEDSSLRGNIQSRPFWRNKNKDGLLKVEVRIQE